MVNKNNVIHDKKIINHLFTVNTMRCYILLIARDCNITHSICARRIQLLIDNGFIEAYRTCKNANRKFCRLTEKGLILYEYLSVGEFKNG